MAVKTTSAMCVLNDALEALQLFTRRSWHRLITAWLYVPVGIIIILLACFGIDSLIGLSTVKFPASVAGLILLYLGLLLCQVTIGDRRTKYIVTAIDVPAGFALRYMPITFTPAFVLLPLSPSISGAEVGKIIAVFVVGFVVMMVVTAYMTRGLQLILGSKKRAMTERAEELGAENDAIPLANNVSPQSRTSQVASPAAATIPLSPASISIVTPSNSSIPIPERAHDAIHVRGSESPPIATTNVDHLSPTRSVQQNSAQLTRSQRWAAFITAKFDWLTYTVLFIFAGIPVYYTTGYAMPMQLPFNVLAFFTALALPAKWRKVLHPVLVSSLITVLGLWVLGLIRGETLNQILATYETNTKYLQLWEGDKGLPAPGAGDILSSMLDASIVSLALPMFRYRKDLYQHFFAIVLPNISLSVAVLFGWPPICYAIGISASRSLAFGARSLNLALAKPAASNLGGDANTVAAIALMSGIVGALVGIRMLRWFRIPDDDYITRGVTMGANSSAIGTTMLLQIDPRAGALSCLSMTLFGVITVALTSVPAIVTTIRASVNLS